jgi:anaerobic selenocysteine-containing dehydrogenase
MKPDEPIVKSTCLVCKLQCGILVHRADGKVISVEGDPDSPANRGKLCLKGQAAVERLYHPNRLKYPLRRVGEKGTGGWERITWDEALKIVAEKLNGAKEEYGAESVVFAIGSPKGFGNYIRRLANVFGTPNLEAPDHVCAVPSWIGSIFTCGFYREPDFESLPACAVVWGKNLPITAFTEWMRLEHALNQGSKLVVVDTKETKVASMADIWLQPRPGTDLALAMGILNVVVNEDIFDKAFVDSWTIGFDRLKEHIQNYIPKKVEEITWVPAGKIEAAARLYAKAKPACIREGNGIEENLNSVQTARALSILSAITGNLDIPGGDFEWKSFPLGAASEFTCAASLPQEQRAKRIGGDGGFIPFPSAEIALPQLVVKAILEERPYPIRAMCMHGTNPLLTFSNVKEAYRALQKLDFLMAVDQVMTPSAALADIVLPAATSLEWDGVVARAGVIQIVQKVAEIGECWPDQRIVNELAKRLGLGEYFWDDINEPLHMILKPLGLTFDEFRKIGIITVPKEFRKYTKGGFKTPSGKVEIYSERFEQWGYDPLPTYHELPETPFSAPEMSKEYPLIFSSCHHYPFHHSADRHIATLRGVEPEPVVEIHPKTADNLGIGEGEWVYIETKRGRIKQKAKLSLGIDPRVVYLAYAQWFPEKGISELYGWQEANINILTDDKPPYDQQMGATNLRGSLCKVYRA